MATVAHDDRGNAFVKWHDAPADYERPVLEIETSGVRRGLQQLLGPAALCEPQGFDPYSSTRPVRRKPATPTGSTSRTDLRKLSEWIKMMRELDERKRRGDSDPEDE